MTEKTRITTPEEKMPHPVFETIQDVKNAWEGALAEPGASLMDDIPEGVRERHRAETMACLRERFGVPGPGVG